MVIIDINGNRKSIGEKYESWISDEIRNRRDQGVNVRITIIIGGDLNLRFVSEDCPSGGGGGNNRRYTPRQKEIIDLWCQSHLTQPKISPGDLISFLKKLEKLI